MSWTHYLVEVAESDFDAVYRAFAALLDLPEGPTESGVTEQAIPDGFLSLALDIPTQFLAARWLQAGRCQELFFVRPATGQPRLSYSIWGAPEASLPDGFTPWLDAVAHVVSSAPSFTTLASLLVSRGSAVRDVNSRERQLEAECEYLKQLLADHAEDLRQVRAQLRDKQRWAASMLEEAPARDDSSEDCAWTLANLPEWCAAHEEEVVVLPRARFGAKKSNYEYPELIGAALDLLAGPYRDYRLGRITRESFDALMYAEGLKLSGSVQPLTAGAYGDAYFVMWAGRRRFLEAHLLKGSDRDERYCFRLYFFWDADSQRVVVGSMPAHLDCSLT